MVGIVAGSALGTSLGSAAVLGARGLSGQARSGRGSDEAYVNAYTGNLVLSAQDDLLSGRGFDAAAVRTYNSQGKLNDDNGDNWSSGAYAQQLRLTGTRNTAGSTLTRIARDGAEAVYAWDATRAAYVSTAGAGAYDTLVYDTPSTNYVWTDGDTGAQERYESAATGRLLSTRDAAGNVLTYGYTPGGLLASMTTANGEQTLYDYSGNSLTQIRTLYKEGSTNFTLTRVRYAYDASNRLTSVTVDLTPGDNSVADGKVYVTTYTYDGTSRRVASVTQSDGSKLAITYVQVGTDWRVATLRDALDNLTRFTYDTATRRTSVTDPLGFVTLYDHDTAGQLTKVTAPGTGATQSYVYDAGNVVRIVDGEGRITDFAYDANGNAILQRDGAGNTVTRTYDARNQLLTETLWLVPDPDGEGPGQAAQPLVTRHVYDGGGKNLLRFVVGPEGQVREHLYNAWGERVSTIDYAAAPYDLSTLATTASPTEAQLIAWVGAQDRSRTQRTDFSWNARSLLQKTTTYATVDAAGNGVAGATSSVTQYVYDQAGLLLKTISPTNGNTVYTYDGLGRELTATDALGRQTVTAYDDAGATTQVTLASGLVTTRTYDRAGRLVSVMEGSAAAANLGETRYAYDADGRLRMTQDPTGVRRWRLYDDAGRQVADIDATGTLTEYSYDRNDRLTRSLTYATAIATGGLVDASGNPTATTLASVRPAANAGDQKNWRIYDPAGRLVKTVDASGAVVETQYDGASRAVRTIAYANRVAVTGFGAAPTSANASPAANAAADRVTRSFFDGAGRLLGVLDAEGYLSENVYDAAGRLVSAARYATATAAAARASGSLADLRPAASADDQRQVFLRDGKGQLLAQLDPEGYLTERTYDAGGNLTKVIRYATRVTAAVLPSTALASIRPAANAEDQVTSWAYDLLDRATQQTDAAGTITKFTFDSVGNLVTTVRASGQPEARTSHARYDVQGRLVAELSAEGAALLTTGQTQAQIDAIWAQHAVAHAYDAASRRIVTTDQNGDRTLFFFDADGRVTHTVNALGEVVERQYDSIGRQVAEVRYGTRIAVAGLSGGLVTPALTTAVDAVRNAAIDARETWTWNANGTLASQADALSNVTTSTWNAWGELASRTSPIGSGVTRTDTVTYDRRGLAVATAADTTGLNVTAQTVYDAFGRAVETRDAKGNVRRQTFDRLGRVVRTVAPDAAAQSTTYDAFDRVLTQTDALGQVTTYTHSTAARSVTVTTPEGISVTTTRTRHGQVASVRDGNGKTTSYTYDRNGNLKTTATPLTTTSQAYDRAGRLIETTDARGIKTQLTYDAAGRVLTRRVDPTGLDLTTRYTFDALGRTVKVTDPRGIDTVTVYDRKGQATSQTVDPTGLALTTQWTWDAQGRTLTVTEPAGTVTQYTYDKLGRRTQERVDPTGLDLKRSWAYDKNGNVTSSTDGLGGVTRYTYDALDRQVHVVDPAGGVTLTAYDANGRILRVTRYVKAVALGSLPVAATVDQVKALIVATAGHDAIDARRYDRDGRLRFSVDGTGAVTRYTLDGNGQVTTRVQYANAVDMVAWKGDVDPPVVADASRDRRTVMFYDDLGRLARSVDTVGAITAYAYDGNGNVTKVTRYAKAVDPSNVPTTLPTDTADRTEAFTYDAANRQIWRADAVGAVVRTEYDRAGNAVRTTQFATAIAVGGTASAVAANAADRVTRREFDAANRVTHVADAMGYVTRHVYDAAGRVLTTTRHALAVASTAAPSAVVTSASDRTDTYTYDRAGRVLTHLDALQGQESFTWDAAGNKRTWTNPKNSVWTYTYDAVGRLLTETSPQVQVTLVTANTTTNALDEGATQTVALVTRMAYDALGNLRSRTEADGRSDARTTTYDHDAVGRQVKVTYPSVQVYNETTAGLATNGYRALAARVETARSLSVATFYDTLGNAVANVDVGGGVSLKAYDAAGRVAYEVDALGYVTGYVRNVFGEAIGVTRYGQGTALAGTAPTSATQAPTTAQVAAVVGAAGFNHAEDRLLTTAYDRLGRAATVTEPQSFVFDATSQTAASAGKQTVNTWNAFGELVKVAQSLTPTTWVNTFHYFDRVGREVAVVDAMGYVTTRTFDAVGNVLSVIEHATALGSGTWNATTYGTPAANAKDRKTDYAYDRLNRKVAETRIGVTYSDAANGTSRTGNLQTTYGYDAVGNLTRTTDALSGSVYSTYDALGRVTAVLAPTRTNVVDDTATTPITLFKRDAYGNVVVAIERATGAVNPAEFVGVSSTTTPGYTLGTASVDDRTTRSTYDTSGHLLQTSDAMGVSRYFSYNAYGKLAKSWQAVADGTEVNTLFEANAYDKLGQLIHTYTPATSGQAVVDAGVEYNAFGEVVRKGLDGGWQEYFRYDSGGRLWLTNSGDGVAKVLLYDLLGRQTSQITSAGGAADQNLALQTSASAVHGLTNTRRTDFVYDALGRVIKQTLPRRADTEGGVRVARLMTTATVVTSASVQLSESSPVWTGNNRVDLSWTSLAGLGSGDIRVDLTYTTLGGPLSTASSATRSVVYAAHEAASGVAMTWVDPGGGAKGGVSAVNRVVVYKKDALGAWQKVVDQSTFGYAGNVIEVTAPADRSTVTRLEMRLAGSTGAYTAYTLVDFGGALRYDATALALGSYEYRVQTTVLGKSAFVSSSGTLTMSAPPLVSIGVPITYGSAGAGILSWQKPSGVTQALRYRAAGTTGAWTALTVSSRGSTLDGVDTSDLAPGSYDFELLWTRSGEGTPYAHAIGTVTVTPPTAPVDVPAVGHPPVSGIGAGVRMVGSTAIDGLYWNAAVAGSAAFLYRPVGSDVWLPATINAVSGVGWVSLEGWPAGEYEFHIGYVTGPTVWAFGSGRLLVQPQGPGHWETRTVIVQVEVTVTPPDPLNYLTGYTRPTYGAPVVTGYDESGTPILGAHYQWQGNQVVGVGYTEQQIIRYDTVQEPVWGDVQVTPPNPANYITGYLKAEYRAPIVIGRDEGGNQVLAAHYAWSGSVVVAVPYVERQIIGSQWVQVPIGRPGPDQEYDWVEVPIWGDVTVYPPDPAPYMTRAPRPTYGSPVVIGRDEAGQPVLGAHYAWQGDIAVAVPYMQRHIVGYTPVQVPVYGPVWVMPPDPNLYILQGPRAIYAYPVFVGYSESGTPILGAHYAWQGNVVVGVPYQQWQGQPQDQQVWVPGTTPPPTTTVTTPPYTPGYTIPGTPKGYAAAVNTPANSSAISVSPAATSTILSQAVTKVDDTQWLRPVISQLVDRWGNVLELNDPRSASWKTRYEYNADNKVVMQWQPNANGGIDATSPQTATFYDALGRQMAVKDALGRVNGKAYDAAGNLVKEFNADGGVVTHGYGIFGQKLATVSAVGNASWATAQIKLDQTTRYTYDKLNRLTKTTYGAVNVFGVTAGTMAVSAATRKSLEDVYVYDAAGRRIRQTDGGGRSISYRYDRRGNVVETRKSTTDVVTATFDAQGRKLSETDANGGKNVWTYTYFGKVRTHDDLALTRFTYTYDDAGQLVARIQAGQTISYAYDAAGQLTRVNDSSLAQVSEYAYDLAGRRVLERTTQGGVVYQDNRLAYDTLGRLRDVSDGRARVQIAYDAAGNRTRVTTRVNLAMAGSTGAADDIRNSDRYFQYDAMNRQTVVDAVDAAGNINPTQGHLIRYDLNGNRVEDTWYGNVVQRAGGEQIIIGYDESSGTALYSTSAVTYQRKTGVRTTEGYKYDAMNRLVSVERDGVQVDQRFYDGSSNVVQTGPNGKLPQGYAEALNQGVAQGDVIGTETRVNLFDGTGRLTQQRVLKVNANNVNSQRNDILYTYDAAGNVKNYVLKNYDGKNYTNTYTYDYTNGKFDSLKDTKVSATTSDSTMFKPGSTVKGYDKSGNLVSVDDTTRNSNDRTFVNDLSGQALQVTQNGNVERQLIVNGEVLGRYGMGINEVKPRAVEGSNQGEPLFKAIADFNFGYQPINGNYPTASAGTYAVRTGDTLRSIARGAYGDTQLWYRIAEANGLGGDSDLRVGQTLTIPSRVGTVHNDDQSVKPYDPSKIIGDTTPNMPVPNSDKGCGGIGMILVIVVAIVVTVFTAGAAAMAIAGTLSSTTSATAIFAAGTSVMTAGAAGGAVAAAAVASSYGTAGLIAAAAVGGAVGSIVSQGVGIAVGVQDKFSWKQVALSAIGSAASVGVANLMPAIPGGQYVNAAARAAVGNAVSQGIGVATGLQESFDWKGVAASAVGSVVAQAVGPAYQGLFGSSGLGQLAARFATGLTSGLAAALMQGGRVAVQQVATDAFGNALAQGVMDEVLDAQLPEAVRNMSEPARQFARIAVDRGLDPTNAEHMQVLESTLQAQFEGREISDAERYKNAATYLAVRVKDPAERAQALNALVEHGILPDIAPLSDEPSPNDAKTHQLPPVHVEGTRYATGVALGTKPLDGLAQNTGAFAKEAEAIVSKQPWIGYALEAVSFAAAPLAYIGQKIIAETPVGTAIDLMKQRLNDAAADRFESVGYRVDDASDGGAGVMTATALALGVTPTQALGQLGRLRGLATGQSFTLTHAQARYPRVVISAEVERKLGPAPIGMQNPHRHHILDVNGREGPQRTLVREGQDILREYQIDPLHGAENIAWAPNKGHTLVNTEALVGELKAAKLLGEPRETVVEILRRAGELAKTR